MATTMTLPMTASLSTGSLEAYIQSVNRFRCLSAEEGQRLARRLRDHGISRPRASGFSHLRLVVAVAGATSGRVAACRPDPGRHIG